MSSTLDFMHLDAVCLFSVLIKSTKETSVTRTKQKRKILFKNDIRLYVNRYCCLKHCVQQFILVGTIEYRLFNCRFFLLLLLLFTFRFIVIRQCCGCVEIRFHLLTIQLSNVFRVFNTKQCRVGVKRWCVCNVPMKQSNNRPYQRNVFEMHGDDNVRLNRIAWKDEISVHIYCAILCKIRLNCVGTNNLTKQNGKQLGILNKRLLDPFLHFYCCI